MPEPRTGDSIFFSDSSGNSSLPPTKLDTTPARVVRNLARLGIRVQGVACGVSGLGLKFSGSGIRS